MDKDVFATKTVRTSLLVMSFQIFKKIYDANINKILCLLVKWLNTNIVNFFEKITDEITYGNLCQDV